MNPENDNFFKSLKDSLANYPEPTPTEADWEDFKAVRAATKQKKKPIIGWLLPSSFIIALLTIGAFSLIIPEKKVSKNTETKTNLRNGLIAKAKPKDVILKKIENEKTKAEAEVIEVKENDNSNKSFNTNNIKPEPSNLLNQNKNGVQEDILPSLINLDDKTMAQLINQSYPILLSSSILKPLKTTQFYAVPNRLDFGSNRKIKKPLHADWVSIWGIGAIVTERPNNFSWGAGFQLGKDFGKGWYTAIGLEYTQMNYQTSNNWNHDFVSHDLVKVDTNLRMNVNLNRIEMVMDSIFEYRTHNENVKQQSLSISRNIDIPLEIGYVINIGKLNIGSNLGIYNRIKHTQTTTLEKYPISNQNKGSFEESYTYQLFSNIGISLGYPINKRILVQASPNLLFNPFEIKSGLLETRIRIGIKYYLN
ncbi:MAG: hypothetical protein FGM41_00960 [Bacteroidetes bacterium]|nr:hypothetical protein [Bacteroidota bacterium]